MKDGNVNEFLDKILYQEEMVLFFDNKYFFNPWYNEKEKYFVLRIELFDKDDNFIQEVFYSTGNIQGDNVKKFLEAPIWHGKTFWNAEGEITWID